MYFSRYLKIFTSPEEGNSLLYSTRTGAILKVGSGLLAAIADGTLQDKELESLRRLNILVDDPAAERAAMTSAIERSNARSGRFRAKVVLNLDCNLACPYCFEEAYRRRQYMARETARELIQWVKREQIDRGRGVQLTFYGGEALLSGRLLREIAEEIGVAARHAESTFSFALVTNGTLLTREVVTELLPLGLKTAQITLDGPQEIHDRQRPFISGQGSFSVIIRNIKDVWDLVDLQLGGNYTSENYRDFPLLLDYLLAEGITPDKIPIFDFAPVMATSTKPNGEKSLSGCVSGSEPWAMTAAPYLRGEILDRGFATSKLAMAACMVELANDLVVNYDGTLYKCPALMGWPELSVGTLAQGVEDYSTSHNLAAWHNDECLDCPYLPICFGGCRYLTLVRTGTMNGVDCRRPFFDATLETTIRQDIAFKARKEAASPTP